ncbi:MAG: hypothetical protein QF357_01590 [Dehalococcoidia bacterium]|nr:hypothetical protein [Dehalococcoidia bacterium]
MLHFKSCPKCLTGTVEHNFDAHGEYAQCLNCGFMRDVPRGASSSEVERALAGWRSELLAAESEAATAIA